MYFRLYQQIKGKTNAILRIIEKKIIFLLISYIEERLFKFAGIAIKQLPHADTKFQLFDWDWTLTLHPNINVQL